MGTYKPYGTGIKESDRYGDLLEKARLKEAQESIEMMDNINRVIEWGKQASKERDEEWEHRKKYADDLMARAKQRLNKEYKI
jgi:ubiquinone biosynthesis protein Coq4